jgi:hypothetical protein
MERDLHKNIPATSEMPTQSTISQNQRKKGRKKLKETYNEKFLIKKVKTRCLKIYFRLLLNCVSNLDKSKWKVNAKKEIFKLFKSDVCKSRNRDILGTSMKEILNLFSNISTAEISKSINHKVYTYQYLMNIEWEEFLLHVKRKNSEFFDLKSANTDPVVMITEITEFFNYIKSLTKYKARNIDINYASLYNELKNSRSNYSNVSNRDMSMFIDAYKEL